jgi:hypothetical protein
MAQITIKPMNHICARPGAGHERQHGEGRAGKHRQRADEYPEPADDPGNPVGDDPHRGVGNGEDRLVHHQDENDGRRRDPDLRGEFWQVDDASGPAHSKHELQDGEIDAGAADAGVGLIG